MEDVMAAADGVTSARDDPGLGAALQARMVAAHARLLARDVSLWPAAAGAPAAWMGWLDAVGRAEEHVARLGPLVAGVLEDGITDVVLTGMGGSSLFPEVLSAAFGAAPGHPRLWVIDSTDPAAVLRIEREVPWTSTLVVAASKSGTTVETRAHLARFLARLHDARGAGAAARVVVVTDPGSPLEVQAQTDGYRAVVLGDPDVGGRYSALSPFGLLPALLLGIDVAALLTSARAAAAAFAADPWAAGGPARLAAHLAAAHDAGRDVVHLLLPATAGGLGVWIEQLVAESTGKHGRGLLPIVTGSALEVVEDGRRSAVALGVHPGVDAIHAAGTPLLVLPWNGRHDLGQELVRWMQAVALVAAHLDVDPFDQPDVAAAKAATAQALAGGVDLAAAAPFHAVVTALGVTPAHYLALLAYVDPGGDEAARLRDRTVALARELGLPVTLGIGPRYLHSTGQLHKGGRDDGRFVVVVGDDPEDAEVPGESYGFSRLKRAQAAGDVAALQAAGRQVDLVDLATLLD
jgi:transaldolase / glucose-6-phosphate isomerase